MTRSWWSTVGLVALLSVPVGLVAQRPPDLVARGIQAYDSLALDAAAGWLRRALTPPHFESLSPASRDLAWAYLGATEHFRGRPDSATAAFRRLLRDDPRARLDPLIFPPSVSGLFEQVRVNTKVAAIRLPRDTTIPNNGGRVPLWLVASSPHDVRLDLASADGSVVRVLYAGEVGDSLPVPWDGRDSLGNILTPGFYFLRVTSRSRGETVCLAQRGFDASLRSTDTLPWPAAPPARDLLPERAGRLTGPRGLTAAMLLAAGALTLPQITGTGNGPAAGRTGLAIGFGVSGLIALSAQPPGRTLPANVAANRARHEAWERRTAEVRALNVERRRAGVLRIVSGILTVSRCGPP